MDKRTLHHFGQSGQAALIVVLMAVVVLTVGLSTVARITTDVRISSQGEDGARAIVLADAGVEKALFEWQTNGVEIPAPGLDWPAGHAVDKPYANYTIDFIGQGEDNYTFERIKKGDVRTVWLSNDPNTITRDNYGENANDLTISWNPQTVDVEFMVYYLDDANNVKVMRGIDNPGSPSIFTNGGLDRYNDKALFDTDTTPNGIPDWLFVRIKPVSGNLDSITVDGYDDASFPVQGVAIVSNGITPQGAIRKVVVDKFHPQLPAIFDYVLYSGGDLRKN